MNRCPQNTLSPDLAVHLQSSLYKKRVGKETMCQNTTRKEKFSHITEDAISDCYNASSKVE